MIRINLLAACLLVLAAAPAAFAQDTALPLADDPELESVEAPISQEELLQRMGQIYELEADILEAEAVGNAESQEVMLDEAVSAIAQLIERPGVLEDVRFRELYRTIVTEFETYYGVEAESLPLPSGSIFDVHEDMFTALDEGTLEAMELPELGSMEATIPMDVNRLVEQSITYLFRFPEKTLDLWRPRAQAYFPMIEQVLREEGMPDELKYLAMIESGLVPNARSWARANGMWQFIAATGRHYGLQVNHWVDERLDPEKSTRAAARHLRDLHEMFGGDWHLAMAGYNCSPARIKRAIRRFERRSGRKATFWDIYQDIPRETRNYVPMFIAAALVVSNPDAFDLKPVEETPRYTYEFVPITGMIDLPTAAEMAGTDVGTLKALNPELRTSMTPPVDGAYPLRVPLGTGDAFMEAYAQLPEAERSNNIAYTVRNGDTMGKIARRYGISVAALKQANGLSGTTLEKDATLRIPVSKFRSTTTPEIAGAAPTRVIYGSHQVYSVPITAMRGPSARSDGTVESLANHTAKPTTQARTQAAASSTATARTASTSGERTRYRVRRGDSLGKIAGRHGVTVSQLRSWNNIRGSKIYPGQYLNIYGKASASSTSASSTSASSTTRYQVRRGDSLGKIASRHGVTVSQLRSWNSIRGSKIYPGQYLTIHGKGSTASTTYRVRRGDSLYTIARRHGVSITQLKRWNNLRSNVIRPGQRLKVKA